MAKERERKRCAIRRKIFACSKRALSTIFGNQMMEDGFCNSEAVDQFERNCVDH